MVIFRLKNLLLGSLLVWLSGCAVPLKYKLTTERKIIANDILKLNSNDSTSTYKAQIFLFNKYFTGILLDKKTDSLTHRLVFVTEIGMKMFDLKITADTVKMEYCFSPLNKPKTIWLLENDFGFLWFQKLINKQAKIYENKKRKRIYKVTLKGKKYLFYVKEGGALLEKSLICGNLFAKQKAVYKYGLDNEMESVSLKHKGLLRLKIKLSKFKHE